MNRTWLILLAFSMLLLTGPAYAHKVTVFAWVEGQTIHTESKFGNGKRVKAGNIEVFDHLDQKVVQGITDDQGAFSFSLPEGAQSLKVVLLAGAGHGNQWQITAEELGKKAAKPDMQPKALESAPPSKDSITVDAKMLEQIVERAVEKKLAPIKAKLAEERWIFRDIFAGLGYILGLMGLASYIHYRKSSVNK